MATFVKRKTGWQAQIRRQGFPRLARTFKTRADAELWAKKPESDMGIGAFIREDDKTTLATALDRYEREISSQKKGYAKERGRLRLWERSPLAPRPLRSIRGMDIAKWRDDRLRTVSAGTVRNDLALLSHLFTIAVREWGMVGLVNPVSQIRKAKPPPGRSRRLEAGEEERLITAALSYNARIAPVIRFGIETGMRREEIAAMTWGMVNFKKRIVALPETKNGEKRDVPLSTEAVSILGCLPRRLDGKVFGISKDYLTTAFIRIRRKAGIDDLTFHDLRHEATSRFFEKGLNPMQVAAITGHKTLQMLKRYTHLKAEDLAELLAKE